MNVHPSSVFYRVLGIGPTGEDWKLFRPAAESPGLQSCYCEQLKFKESGMLYQKVSER